MGTQQSPNYKIVKTNQFKLFNGEAWKFKNPDRGAHYLIGVDTAPEHGSDKSAITIWDFQTLEQVWEYQGKLPVLDFISIVKAACSQYPGTLIVESNSYGNQVLEEIGRSEYMSMLYKEKRGLALLVPGLSTNIKSRPLMMDALYSYITEFPTIIKSKRLILELIGLVTKNNGRVEADVGCKDDLALSAAMCFYCHKYDPPLMVSARNLNESGFSDVMGMNDIRRDELQNSEIIQYVKENIGTKIDGFVDVLSMYNKV